MRGLQENLVEKPGGSDRKLMNWEVFRLQRWLETGFSSDKYVINTQQKNTKNLKVWKSKGAKS